MTSSSAEQTDPCHLGNSCQTNLSLASKDKATGPLYSTVVDKMGKHVSSCFRTWTLLGERVPVLVPRPGIEPVLPAFGAQSLNHQCARETPAYEPLVPCGLWLWSLVYKAWLSKPRSAQSLCWGRTTTCAITSQGVPVCCWPFLRPEFERGHCHWTQEAHPTTVKEEEFVEGLPWWSNG